jgi:hypothetical protein
MINQLIPSLISQENIFKKQSSQNQPFVPVSSGGSNSKKWKTCIDFEFVKHCLLAAAKEMCSDKKLIFQDISLSTKTCIRTGNKLISTI